MLLTSQNACTVHSPTHVRQGNDTLTCKLVWFWGAASASAAAVTTGSKPEALKLKLVFALVFTRLAAVTTCRQYICW